MRSSPTLRVDARKAPGIAAQATSWQLSTCEGLATFLLMLVNI